MDSSYFDKFQPVIDKYMPSYGEGESMASQIVTAVNKLIYKWYNDGDVFDNTRFLTGWANDLSSYANWLYTYVPKSQGILEGVWECYNDIEYEALLADLADVLLNDDDLAFIDCWTKMGSIYECEGPFAFVEYSDDEEEECWEDDSDDDL